MTTADEYLALMRERADDLIEDGYIDLIVAEMDALELNKYYKALHVIATAALDVSTEMATDDLRDVMRAASLRLAMRNYRAEMAAASERLAVERFYQRCLVPA
jgi:hypothetical protein